MAKNYNLSASLEDYLEAILNLSSESSFARSKDIAKSLGVSRSSVTGAMRVLKEKGLANYKPYDYVTLTESGRSAAAEIARKHNILKSFFIDVLGVEAEVAQKAACKTEHELGPEIITKLLCFIEFVTQSSKNGRDLADEFQKFCKNINQHVKVSEITTMEDEKRRQLSKVKAGETVKLAGIEAGRDLHSRLASMGLVTNVEITVVRNSERGPFVISVKNSKMMLGREMAHKIMVL
ncbi:MAG: metal-dependent transcriptional regulator [Planctomycetes bacterium]|nr:metal-dependent transcriptional regulator [Planctomycetota bacterium]